MDEPPAQADLKTQMVAMQSQILDMQSQILNMQYLLIKLLALSNKALSASRIIAIKTSAQDSELKQLFDEADKNLDKAVERLEDNLRGRS